MGFLKQQLQQLASGDSEIYRRKLLRLYAIFKNFVTSAAGLLFYGIIVALLRLLSPFLLIRFGRMRGNRIGHSTLDIETYLSERDLGMHRGWRTPIDIWYIPPGIELCNRRLFEIWKRVIKIWPSRLAQNIDELNQKLPGAVAHKVPCRVGGNDFNDVLRKTACHLRFNQAEIEEARRLLERMGLNRETPVVCVYARDQKYLEKMFPQDDWSYHNYRNSSIENYIPAMRAMAKRGYAAVRIGSEVEQPLGTNEGLIFDYSTNGHRTELLDLYLCAICRFIIGSASGLDSVAIAFRRPQVTVNFGNMAGCKFWQNDHLFIPKRFWLQAEQRYLTFNEIFNSEICRFYSSEQFFGAGIELRENTAEEILDVVDEMDQRLSGAWSNSNEGEELQERFLALVPEHLSIGGIRARIGTNFLLKNRNLLS